MSKNLSKIKEQIIAALGHPEAEEGLYFRNFRFVHEEDERPVVNADRIDLLDALNQLISEGKVQMDQSCDEAIFHLAGQAELAKPRFTS